MSAPTREQVSKAQDACPCWGNPRTGPPECSPSIGLVCELHHAVATLIAEAADEARRARDEEYRLAFGLTYGNGDPMLQDFMRPDVAKETLEAMREARVRMEQEEIDSVRREALEQAALSMMAMVAHWKALELDYRGRATATGDTERWMPMAVQARNDADVWRCAADRIRALASASRGEQGAE